jgi:UTP:GlnB (protein PII) uridylyltransferase
MVRAADRVGLLHDLALALSSLGLDIRSVTALTSDGVARDTFRVVDAFGQPPRDPGLLARTQAAMLEAADGNPNGHDPGPEERP